MRVFQIKVLTVAAVMTVATLLVTPRLLVAQDGSPYYCCVCAGCPNGVSRQCISVEAPGFEETDCTNRCSGQNCGFLEVLEGQCALHASECTPSLAPAASHSVLLALGVLLVGGGVYLVRRRVAGKSI
jgi:hypothetical protein